MHYAVSCHVVGTEAQAFFFSIGMRIDPFNGDAFRMIPTENP
jgi:hypothetical protein